MNNQSFKKKSVLFVIILVTIAVPLAIFLALHQQKEQQMNESLPWLTTKGNKIVTANSGQEVLLHGVNDMESEWHGNMDWEAKAIPEFANNWKGNIWVRGFASDPINSNDASYLSMMDQYVSLTAANRIYIVFSWRSFEINGEQPNMPDDRAERALAKLAARYKDKPNVIYSLQVEPHDVSWSQLRPRFDSMVAAIRQAAAPNEPLIMVPGTDWSRDLNGAITDSVKGRGIVYNSHPYNAASEFQTLFGDAFDAGLPVFIGEFGPWTNGMTDSDVMALLALTKQKGIGWAAWAFDYDANALINQSLQPTSIGTIIKNEMLSTPPIPS